MAAKLPHGLFPDFTLLNKMNNMDEALSYYHVKDKSGTDLMLRCGRKSDLENEYDLPRITNGLIVPRECQIVGDKMGIVFEYPINGHNLEDKIMATPGPIKEEIIKIWVFDILMCLKELNDNRYFHNNLCLKSALVVNLVGDEHIKLTGVRNYIRLEPEKSFMRTFDNPLNLCTPPEQLKGELRTRSSDIWSLGVMIYFMMTKKYPFTDDVNLLHDKLTEYEKTPHTFPKLPHYSKELTDLLASCLVYDNGKRPNAHKLLDLNIFKEYLITRPFMTCAVIRSKNCKDMTRENTKGSRNKILGREMYRCGILNWIEKDKETVQVAWILHDPGNEYFSNVKIGDIEVCTATSIDDYVIPLFQGVKVKRGPDWLDTIHGNNDEYGAGTVLQVVPGSDAECNRVRVQWPTTGRIVEYYYGNYCGVQKYEVLPAYHPILPSMKVHNLPNTPKFEGIITKVMESGEEAEVVIDKKPPKILSYGKDNKFDFMIDDSYCADFDGVDIVTDYLKTIDNPCYEVEPTGDQETKIKESVKIHYRGSLRGETQDAIQEGMFFIVPPNIKKCTFGIIDKIVDNKIKARAVLENSVIIPIGTDIIISNQIRQCSFGNNKFPPLLIGDKVTDKRSEEYEVMAIYSAPATNGKLYKRNWQYIVCKSVVSGERFEVFRFDEVSKKAK